MAPLARSGRSTNNIDGAWVRIQLHRWSIDVVADFSLIVLEQLIQLCEPLRADGQAAQSRIR
jgi:hypothetical protein